MVTLLKNRQRLLKGEEILQVFKNVHELIGNTPIVELSQFPFEGVRMFAKLEFLNPGGSVKDRLGLELIKAAFESGKLKKRRNCN